MASRSSLKNYFLLTWKVEDFSCFIKKKNGEFLESPKFSESSSSYEQWTIRLYAKDRNSNTYLSFQLCRRTNFNSPEVFYTSENTVDFVISILAKDGLTTIGEQMHHAQFTTQSSESRIYDFVKLEELTSRESFFLPEDTLTIECNLMRPVKQHILTVRFQVEKLSFTWIIRHFSKICISQFDPYTVPVSCLKCHWLLLKFQIVGKSIVDTYLRIDCTRYYPGRSSSICSSGCKHFDSSSISVSFLVSISDISGRKIQLVECEHAFISKNDSETFCLPDLMKRSDLIARRDLFLMNDNLTLLFDLKISDLKCNTTDERRITTLPSPPQQRGKALSRILLEDKRFCDVTLKIGNEDFHVHKSVVSSKSPVFDSMFTCETHQKGNGVVDIVNITSETLKHLLQYMYTDTLDDGVLDDVAVAHLYSAAHIYQVTSLVEHCSSMLKSKITVETVWDIASFAATYKDTSLIEATKYFISQQPSDCMKSNRWETLLQGQSFLLNTK